MPLLMSAFVTLNWVGSKVLPTTAAVNALTETTDATFIVDTVRQLPGEEQLLVPIVWDVPVMQGIGAYKGT